MLYDSIAVWEEDAGNAEEAVVFSGVPQFVNGEAVLADSSDPSTSGLLPHGIFAEIHVSFRQGSPPADTLGRELAILIYVEDMVSPRAKIRLSDLARQGWRRPLNISRQACEAVRIVLTDPDGVLASGAPEMEVSLL
jgi:Ca-activated chloride channel family protein